MIINNKKILELFGTIGVTNLVHSIHQMFQIPYSHTTNSCESDDLDDGSWSGSDY